MALPSVTFRSELPPVVRKELDQLDSELTGYLTVEHDEDGHHTHISAKSITINGKPVEPSGAPALHAPTHSSGASDPVDVKNLAGYPGTTSVFLRGDKTFQPVGSQNPTPHHLSHEPGGADPLSNVAWTNLANTFAENQRVNKQVSAQTFAADNWASAITGYYERNRPVTMGEWQGYTPTWVTGGVAPSLGNGALSGAYALVGKTVFFRISFTTGSTTNCGTGPMVFGLPFSPSQLIFGSGWMYAHTGVNYTAVAINGNFLVGPVGVALVMNNPAGNAGLFQQGGPITLTNPDYVFIQGMSEIA